MRLPGGGDASHLVPRPEKGHQARPVVGASWGGGGGKDRRGVSSDYCSQVSWGPCGGWGRGRAEARLGFKELRARSLPGNLPVALLCFCIKCPSLKAAPVAGSPTHDKDVLVERKFKPSLVWAPHPRPLQAAPDKPASALPPATSPTLRRWARHAAGRLRAGTPLLRPLSFGRPTG